MISIGRLKEMALEELETELNNWKEQVELQSNFIDSLLKATNNYEWLNKTILDDESSEIIEKIELDYAQLDQLKKESENWESLCKLADKQIDELQAELEALKSFDINLVGIKECEIIQLLQYRQAFKEIKEIAEETINSSDCYERMYGGMCARPILQKISECEVE